MFQGGQYSEQLDRYLDETWISRVFHVCGGGFHAAAFKWSRGRPHSRYILIGDRFRTVSSQVWTAENDSRPIKTRPQRKVVSERFKF